MESAQNMVNNNYNDTDENMNIDNELIMVPSLMQQNELNQPMIDVAAEVEYCYG